MKKILHTPGLALLSMTLLLLSTFQAQAEAPVTHYMAPNNIDIIATTDIDLKFVTLPSGQFVMGTTDIDEALADLPDPEAAMIKDETPAHNVVFQQPLLLSQTEVTQKVWLDVMHTQPGPDENWQASNWQQLPVVSVSWHGANEFINKLNKTASHFHYRLPTEAEWEYAARAGSAGLRPFTRMEMGEYAWYINSSGDEVQAVAQLQANAWGLYDMYGNVWEWVSDWYSPTSYANSLSNNPQGPDNGTKKIRRGGSYHCPPHLIRSAYRAADSQDKAYSVLGFRLVAEKK